MSEAQWQLGLPVLDEFCEQAIRCWNFAGGFEVDKLHLAAVFYGVENLDYLIRLCMLMRE